MPSGFQWWLLLFIKIPKITQSGVPNYANSYREVQKGSGPDFPNVNYGVKFLKFDSEQFLDFQKDFKEKIF